MNLEERRTNKLILFFTVILLFSAGNADADFFSVDNPEAAAEKLVSKMSIEQLAGQVMMLGYSGDFPSPEILDWIRSRNLGGIKIFGWNTDNLSRLSQSIKTMQAAAQESAFSIPLFIATDQEGGWVRHVRGSTSVTPGNMALGAASLASDAWLAGKYIGEEIAALGINMNFAPAVDLLINHNAHVIGPRAFSDNPLETAVLATSFFNGMRSTGIICTAKHFPGHGRTEVDSHGRLPVIDVSLEKLKAEDLLPYDFLIRENIPAIMSGHLAFPEITGDITPASLSPWFLKDLLRDQMGFKGIIITDDLQMTGALYKSNIARSSLLALKAGNDMILVSRNLQDYEMTIDLIIREMQEDADFKNQIVESVKRIITVKHSYLYKSDSSSNMNYTMLPTSEASEFFRQQAFRSVSGINSIELKVPSNNEKILLAGQFRYFFEEGLKRFPEADTFYFPYRPFYTASAGDILTLREKAKNYDIVIFCLANPGSMEILSALESLADSVIVLSVLSPAYFSSLEWVKHGIAVYGTGRDSFTAGFSAIAGDYKPEGRLPITIQGKRH